jgi:cell division protein FtsB
MSRNLPGRLAYPGAPFVTQQREELMRILAMGVAAAGLLALAACNNTPAEQAADNIIENAENTADILEEQADNATSEVTEDRLENQADVVRDVAENKAEAVEDAGENAGGNTVGM